MNRIYPDSLNSNSVALRVNIEPPGFLISRFYFNYKNNIKLDQKNLIKYFRNFAKKNFKIINTPFYPLGSKAFSNLETSSVILTQDEYFKYYDNLYNKNISMLKIQSYVHNTLGYSVAVIDTLNKFIKNKKIINIFK